MPEETPRYPSGPLPLPDNPDLEWLRKHAKRRLDELRLANPAAKLAQAQLELAREYGFSSWRALKSHIDTLGIEGQLFDAAQRGDADSLAGLLDQHPRKLIARKPPYGWTLLHVAAHGGHLAVVDLLLARGLDVNAREKGDETYAMHWAAAAGHLDVIRRLADAGGDVVGRGDDHELEVIGWASCWDGCDDDAHRGVVAFLLSRGARHHIFSAIAMDLGEEVRRIVAADPASLARPMSRNENRQRPLHFAVRRNRPEMVALLLELGGDPAATDDAGVDAATYAATPGVGRDVLEALLRHAPPSLYASLALGHDADAARLLDQDPAALHRGGVGAGALHLLSKRGDARAVRWLLDRGADVNGYWSHWGAEVTPLHLASWQGNTDVVRVLLAAGADPLLRDSEHDGEALGWAEHAGRLEVVRTLREHSVRT